MPARRSTPRTTTRARTVKAKPSLPGRKDYVGPSKTKSRSITVGEAAAGLGRFAGEVSTNYARGVGRASKAVGDVVGRVNAPSPIKSAMHTPENNPLKNLLRGGKRR